MVNAQIKGNRRTLLHHILQCCSIGVFNHDNLPMTLVAVNWMSIEVSCRVSTSLSVVTLRSVLWLHLPYLVCFSRFSDIIRCHFNLLVRHSWTRNFKTYTLTCYFSTSLKCQHSQQSPWFGSTLHNDSCKPTLLLALYKPSQQNNLSLNRSVLLWRDLLPVMFFGKQLAGIFWDWVF